MSNALALLLPPPVAAAKILLLVRAVLGRDTDTDAPPLRRCTGPDTRLKGIFRAVETAALRARTRDKRQNFIVEAQ